MKKQKVNKFILTLITIISLVLSNAQIALAGIIPVDLVDIDATSVLQQIEERYHLNRESLMNMGEGFNVSDTKKYVPQVMFFFDPTDPKMGEKITAEALPMYFNSNKENLYYTWYLKHKDCDKCDGGDCDPDDLEICDKDDDNDIDENDWKIEAMRKITNNDYDTAKADYGSDTDQDGYDALWGGEDKKDVPAYCYVHDFENGINYELHSGSSSTVSCPAGMTPMCLLDEHFSCSANNYSVCKEDSQADPYCDFSTNEAACSNGTPTCMSTTPTEYSCASPPVSEYAANCLTLYGSNATPSCTFGTSSAESFCEHLFPEYRNFDNCMDFKNTPNDSSDDFCIDLDNKEVGDGSFGEEEEAFWRTDSHDPDTADNGNKDEGNAVGLGRTEFTWTYFEDDEIGVVVEGASMVPTKHDDSSMMIMWALPKNDCPVQNKGEYSETIKGYSVEIPTANMDIDDCLERNLVDPREGGQPKRINVSLSYSPENPVNDPTSDEMGDTLVAQATIDNTSSSDNAQILYEWSVEISSSPYDDNSWTDITTELIDNEIILDPTNGIGQSSLSLKLGLNSDTFSDYDDYFSEDDNYTGYLKIKVVASENFSSDVTREGKSDVIVKVLSTNEKMIAHVADVNNEKLEMGADPICQDNEHGQYPICYVLKNEIIGVEIENADDTLSNFSWTLDGNPLTCTSSMSSLCRDDKQTNSTFFPVTGDTGDEFTVNISANDIESGKTIQLSRVFQIINPFVKIISADSSSWPKYLGTYRDLDGLCGSDPSTSVCADYSDSLFKTTSGATVSLSAEFHPQWLIGYLGSQLQTEWIVDGVQQDENSETTTFTAGNSGSVNNISLNTNYAQSADTRKALRDIWNISPFDTPEKYMSASVQIEVITSDGGNETAILEHPGKFIAGLLSYFPSQLMFLLRILLTIFVILLTTRVVFSFIPDPYFLRQNRQQEE